MRIGIDHHIGLTHAPGSGRYIRELTRALTEIEGDFGLRLLDFGRNPRLADLERADLAPAGDGHVERRLRLPLPRRLLRPLARWGLAPDRLLGGVDWFHSAAPLGVPFVQARTSCALGELPEEDAEIEVLRRAHASTSLVFVFSSFAREVVMRRLGLSEHAVAVVPVGADHWARRLAECERPPGPPRIILLGVQRASRSPMRVLRALECLAERGVDFRVSSYGRIAGSDPDFERGLRESKIAEWVERSEPNERDLPVRVASATLMIHLDRGALTAVTPLEACAAGCPVLLDDSPVFREVLREHATFLTLPVVEDARAFAAAIERELAGSWDPSRRAQRRELAKRFTWRASAAAHVAAWCERLERRAPAHA